MRELAPGPSLRHRDFGREPAHCLPRRFGVLIIHGDTRHRSFVMLVQLALGIAIGYGPRPTRRVALRLSAAEPPPEGEPPFSYAEHSIREQASAAVWNLVVKPAVERRRSEMEAASSAPPLDAAAYDATLARAPILVPEDAPAIAAAVAATAAATPQEVDAVALAVHELSAVAGSEGVPYSASQIVHAFNAWKTAVGRKYSNLDGEALELRAFAGNPSLIAKVPHPNPGPNQVALSRRLPPTLTRQPLPHRKVPAPRGGGTAGRGAHDPPHHPRARPRRRLAHRLPPYAMVRVRVRVRVRLRGWLRVRVKVWVWVWVWVWVRAWVRVWVMGLGFG
jgi:hypothetical protein